MRALLLIPFLALPACISQEQAVDMGLGTSCEATGVAARAGDPAGRYVQVETTEVCRGRDAYTETRWTLIDCAAPARLTAVRSRTGKTGADNAAEVSRQQARIRAGITDFAGVQAGFASAGIAVVAVPGEGADECRRATL
jgi:hypothetical protein